MIKKFEKLRIDFYNEIEESNKMIRATIFEKADKEFLDIWCNLKNQMDELVKA
jgi:hypothetical protein